MQLEITKELLKYTFGYTPQLDVNEKHGYPFNTPQIIYNAVQINRPQKPENIV